MISRTDQRPYMNVIFGNFYSPAYDDESFIDEAMRLIKELGFNSVMFDTKAWEDFKGITCTRISASARRFLAKRRFARTERPADGISTGQKKRSSR